MGPSLRSATDCVILLLRPVDVRDVGYGYEMTDDLIVSGAESVGTNSSNLCAEVRDLLALLVSPSARVGEMSVDPIEASFELIERVLGADWELIEEVLTIPDSLQACDGGGDSSTEDSDLVGDRRLLEVDRGGEAIG